MQTGGIIMHLRRWLTALSLFGAGLISMASAEDWPGFRGPGSTGRAEGISVPLEWSREQYILWMVTMPDVAWSSPIVVGDKIFISTAITENQRKPGGGGGGGRPGGGGGRPPGGGGGGGGPPCGGGGQGGFGRSPAPPN